MKGGFIFADQFLQLSAQFVGKIYGIGEHQTNFQLDTNWSRFTLFNRDVVPLENVSISSAFYVRPSLYSYEALAPTRAPFDPADQEYNIHYF